MAQLTRKEKDELTTRFHATEEQVEKAAQLIFDGSLEKDFETLQSLMGTEKEKYSFCAKFFEDPVKKLALDILFYYGKRDN